MNKQPHILLSRKDISPYVLLPGDPGRVEYIASTYLEKSVRIAQNREFTTFTGMYRKKKITVTSTGIGCPSTAIATEELINLGATNLVRVGTCGGALRKDIAPGSIIIPTACIREEGTTKEYIAPEFPSVADFTLTLALVTAARNKSFPYIVGINRTHDAFYGQAKNIKAWGSPFKDPRMKSWPYPVVSSEMEASALFIIATMRGVRAGAVLAVNADPEPLQEIVEEKVAFSVPKTKILTSEAVKSVDRAILTALEAFTLLPVCK